MAQRHELDLTVGDVFHVGDTTITIIDIDNGEVTFRIDDQDPHLEDNSNHIVDNCIQPLPR